MGDVVTCSISSGDGCGTGNLVFSWHCESETVTSGSPPGCSVGDTVGTLTGTASISTGITPKDGTYSLYVPTGNCYYLFDDTAEDIGSHTAGRFDVWVYVTTFITAARFVSIRVSANNIVSLDMITSTNNQFRITHTGNNTVRAANTSISGGFALNTWYHVIAQWDYTPHNTNEYLHICADTDSGTTNCNSPMTTSLVTWTESNPNLYVGNSSGNNAAYYLDILKVYNVATW